MDHTKRSPWNFGQVWSYMAWGKSIFMFLDISETHFITKYLQVGPRDSRLILGFFESQGTISGAIKPTIFPKNDTCAWTPNKIKVQSWSTGYWVSIQLFVSCRMSCKFAKGGGVQHTQNNILRARFTHAIVIFLVMHPPLGEVSFLTVALLTIWYWLIFE